LGYDIKKSTEQKSAIFSHRKNNTSNNIELIPF